MKNQSSKTYSEKLRDPRWQKKRLLILERDKWRCQYCSDDKSTLHIHHKFYEKDKDPWDYEDDMLTTLCEHCHEEESTSYYINQSLLKEIRRHFNSNEIITISLAFYEMKVVDSRELMSRAINRAISNPATLKTLIAEVLKENVEPSA